MNKILLRSAIRYILKDTQITSDTEREEVLEEIMDEVYDAFGIPKDDENEDD